MSRENFKVVHAAIDALNRGDIDAVLKDVTPDFEFDFSRAVGPTRGVFGAEEVPAFWRQFVDTWESVRIESGELIDAGDDVVVPWTLYARGRGGIEVRTRVTLVWTIRSGAIVRTTLYQEREEALAAAGMQEG